MPISYKHRVIFIHIPKCAGSSIEKMLNTTHVEELYTLPISLAKLLYIDKKLFTEEEYKECRSKTAQHFTYRELKRIIPPYYFKDYFTFSVVRNPYSRLVSEYNYLSYRASINQAVNGFRPTSFVDFTKQLTIPTPQRIELFDGHLETQSSFLTNESGKIGAEINIYRFESLDECFTVLKNITGCADTPHERKSPLPTPYQEYYDKDLQNTVYSFYKEDFDTFGYSYTL